MTRTAGVDVLAWDASAMHHFIKIDRFDVLLDLAHKVAGPKPRSVTTEAVRQELSNHDLVVPPRIEIVHVDGLEYLPALIEWLRRLSSGPHNRGEATVCAWAEISRATVLVDDGDARQVAHKQGLSVHGSLWVIDEAIRKGHCIESGASMLIDSVIESGARYPFTQGGLSAWRSNKLG